MKTAGLAFLGATLLLAGHAFAGENETRDPQCIVRPGYWGYAPIYCDGGSTPTAGRFKSEHARRKTSLRD
jgi:hypothetical protein